MSTSRPPDPAAAYHHGALREALIAAALELLREGGHEALSLRAAARRIGVSAMAPYRHFASKDALLAAVAARGFGRLAAELAAADAAAADPAGALADQAGAYIRFACRDPALFRLMFGAARPRGHPELQRAAGAAYAVLAGRVALMADADRRADLTLACWSLVHGMASLLVDGQLPGREAEAVGVVARATGALLREG